MPQALLLLGHKTLRLGEISCNELLSSYFLASFNHFRTRDFCDGNIITIFLSKKIVLINRAKEVWLCVLTK